MITNCYLASYALVNFSTFHIDLIQPVGWRPTFRYYNKWLSLLGCGLSVSAMFLCSWPTALVTSAVVFTLFMVVKHRKPGIQIKYKYLLLNKPQFLHNSGRCQLGFFRTSSSLQDSVDYCSTALQYRRSRQDLHTPNSCHDGIT